MNNMVGLHRSYCYVLLSHYDCFMVQLLTPQSKLSNLFININYINGAPNNNNGYCNPLF